MSVIFFFFFFKQKTAYEMRISDWSSDVCSSDLTFRALHRARRIVARCLRFAAQVAPRFGCARRQRCARPMATVPVRCVDGRRSAVSVRCAAADRSEEHTSELQSLMRISYAVFCLKKKTKKRNRIRQTDLHIISN